VDGAIGERRLRLNARRIETQANRFSILLAIEDVTELDQATRELQSLSGRLLRLRDEERRRLARELHDSTGQKLVALKLALGGARQGFKGQAPQEIDSAMELSDEITKDLRLSHTCFILRCSKNLGCGWRSATMSTD